MIILILLIYLEEEETINKFFKFIVHKFKMEMQNKRYREEKEKQKKYYEDKKRTLRKETEKTIKEMDLKTEEEIKKIENKYKKIIDDLDSIKDKNQIIDYLNNFINMK
jgi:hypothetical protein